MIPTTDHACIPSTGGVVTAVENKIHHTERCIGTSDVTFLFQNKKNRALKKVDYICIDPRSSRDVTLMFYSQSLSCIDLRTKIGEMHSLAFQVSHHHLRPINLIKQFLLNIVYVLFVWVWI